MKAGSNVLAILGGRPVRKRPFPAYPVIGKEEKKAVLSVLEAGHLSMFAASAGPQFLGGPKIREFERAFLKYHKVKHAVSVNSGTAGLHIALASLGIGPGDEVITTPYTFTSTATAILMHNAIPVFADVDPATFNLDPRKVKKAITKRTKALIVVHLLGLPAEMDEFINLAKEHHLGIIEDCAQAVGAVYHNRLVGTIGDAGVFSFQETKNIATGEGGMVITDDSRIVRKCRMLRNHGEIILEGKPRDYLSNMVGWNYRMTELEAAVGIEQLKKLDKFNSIRIGLAGYLSQKLINFTGITLPQPSKNVRHVYNVYGIRYDKNKVGIPRDVFIKALNVEGIPATAGYPRPLYLNPLFQKKIAYGNKGCPFSCSFYNRKVKYEKGLCPIAEDLCENSALWFPFVRPPATTDDMADVASAFTKIFSNIKALKRAF